MKFKLAIIQTARTVFSGEVEIEAETRQRAVERLLQMVQHEQFHIEEHGGEEDWQGTQRTEIGYHEDDVWRPLFDTRTDLEPPEKPKSSLVLEVNLEELLTRARALLDKVWTWEGDDETERKAVTAELDEVLSALAGLPTVGKGRVER